MTDILIVEDNKELGGLMKDFLAAKGYKAKLALSGEEAVLVFEAEEVKLILLDIMLPEMDGFAVLQKMREKTALPILILSAKAEKDDKLNGLLLGADDYMEKPFDLDLLLAKIDGIFKRRYGNTEITDGNLTIDKTRRLVFCGEKSLNLTGKEYDLLLFLMENKGKTLTKEELFRKIWGIDSFSEPQTLTVHINWLREKIEKNPKKPVRLLTVWGIGYRFV